MVRPVLWPHRVDPRSLRGEWISFVVPRLLFVLGLCNGVVMVCFSSSRAPSIRKNGIARSSVLRVLPFVDYVASS